MTYAVLMQQPLPPGYSQPPVMGPRADLSFWKHCFSCAVDAGSGPVERDPWQDYLRNTPPVIEIRGPLR